MRFSLLRMFGYFLGGLWTAWGGRKRIEAKQRRNLRRLVEKARADSPLFHRLYADVPPSSEVELRDLPVTRKPDLMRAFDDWLTIRTLPLEKARAHLADMSKIGVPIGGVAVFRTSGTSGEPAIIVLPSRFLEYSFGISLARFERYHWKFLREMRERGMRVTVTGGNGHFAGTGYNKLVRSLHPRLVQGVTFVEAEQPIARLVEQLNAIPVSNIVTYPSVLTILVKEKEAGRLKIEPVILNTGGETLTNELRERVRRAFPSLKYGILDAYGCTECLVLSFVCSHGRKHVHEDWVILEAVDDTMRPVPDGTLSDTALLTVLANDAQPFIRYDIGDCIRFHTDPCPCGSPFRSFEVEGREATLVHVGDATLSPLIFELEHERARRVQLAQTGEREFEIRIDAADEATAEVVFQEVSQSVQRVFRDNGLEDITVRKSETPPQLTASGKFHEVLPLRGVKREG
ncbi:phenylacetate-coenzyme A ligase PaaK-like adenylate-forming protein [Parvibaculum indicum]|uniref:phenylacetate--CoA ligase family protein n=1 Tax=Parvibaculum indicum TaxID=562969 RepID=UPI00141EDC87|nr:AMP-binding protein [Parvibaculum indicum]NIJ43253.1 phenylacetate-coenzyme A ligase PaaK-like adenylate-forming protein [Parvibaculum indicum]